MSDDDAPLILPRSAVAELHQLLGRLLGEEDRAQSSAAEGDGICTATIKSLDTDRVICCAQVAGHYDENRVPDPVVDDGPGGWHQSTAAGGDGRTRWSDRADGATPHKEAP